MREYLFRGKIADNYYVEELRGTWIEGNLIHQTEYYGLPVDRYHILYTGEFDMDYYDSAVVIPETIGQFTGRIDKNGIKVFENDILRTFTQWADGTFERAANCVVKFDEHDQAYVLCNSDSAYDRYDDFGNYGRPEYYEVIGNIHDNPELLEV